MDDKPVGTPSLCMNCQDRVRGVLLGASRTEKVYYTDQRQEMLDVGQDQQRL